MYGIVNKAIEDLVKSNYGESKWVAVKEGSGIDVDSMLSNEPYEDEITYKLACAVAKEMDIPVQDILEAFGEWWALETGDPKYINRKQADTEQLKRFLLNLPNFHQSMILNYPKLSPPEFKVTDVTDRSVRVHYFSRRRGLQDFVRGVLNGLGKVYQTMVNVELVESRDSGGNHEVFSVSW